MASASAASFYGYRPFQDEPDLCPLPEADPARAEIGACLETLTGLLTGTRLEDDLDGLLWACVNVFRRNDQMLETLPIGLIAFPGSGITQNLADKARKMGVPVWRFGVGGMIDFSFCLRCLLPLAQRRQYMSAKQVAFGGMRIARQDEGLQPQRMVRLQLR